MSRPHAASAARKTVIWAAVLLSGLAASPARAACTSPAVATVSLPAVAGPPIVQALLDGRSATFILDTGAERSVLAAAGRARLGLPPDAWVSTAMRGIGGIERHADAHVASLSLAGLPLARRLGPVRSLPVVPDLVIPADGLLGADLLAAFDLELAGGGLTLILHRPDGCAGLSAQAARASLFPWAQAVVPSLAVKPGLFIVAARIGGLTLRTLVDTGAQVSILSPAAAARLGVDPADLEADRAGTSHGVGPASIGLRLHDFGPVTLAGAAAAIPLGAGPLWVGALPPRAFDLLLGMDRLRALHLGLSHATDALYIARLPHTD